MFTLASIKLFLLPIIGKIAAHWRVIAVCASFLILLVGVAAFVHSCGKREVKLDIESLEKINSQNEKIRKQELQNIVEENQEVITTNDGRSTLTDVHVQERNAEIDKRVKAADKAIMDAKQSGKDITAEQLEKLLLENQ